jgi:ATP synthase F1 epsilon subunit
MKVEVLSKIKTVLSLDNCLVVTLNTVSGYISIYPSHAHLVSRIDVGHIEIETSDGVEILYAEEGIIRVENDEVKILVAEAIKISDIDIYDATNRRDDALQVLESTIDLDEQEMRRLEAIVHKENIKLDVAKLRH